jgi:hypothetical protein
MNRTLTLLIAAIALADFAPSSVAAGDTPTVKIGGARAAAAPERYHGVAIQLANGYKPAETYRPLIAEVADLGADTVLLSPAGYMEHARSQGLYIDVRHTPSTEALKSLINDAHAQGLRVILMPIVLLSHPRGSEWRGVIDPPDWDDWWRQYREFVAYFADIARETNTEALMIGSELVSSEKYTAEWGRVIEVARERFHGKLGYSANWDHYKPIEFWDRIDLIGMTSYYTLADHESPTIDEIADRWRPVAEEITDWAAKTGKPLVLTEVGWCSQEGAAKAPWNYYQNMHATPAGHEEQRRLYEAFLRVWEQAPGLGGVIWWEWTVANGGTDDYGYTPKNKPAEAVLRRWFGEQRKRSE